MREMETLHNVAKSAHYEHLHIASNGRMAVNSELRRPVD
jgi:hypothetical protein